LNNILGQSSLVALCGRPFDNGAVILQYRDTPNSPAVSENLQNSVDRNGVYSFKLIKSQNSITCYYSKDDGVTWKGPATKPIPFVGTFHVGVFHSSHENNPFTSEHSNIQISGFSGLCNNRGDCTTINSINYKIKF